MLAESSRASVRAAVMSTVVAGLLVLLILDDWFVNFDGGGYLALAKSLSTGQGFSFPDGSFGAVRGPGYPTLLSLPWLVLAPTAKSAIWASRAVLVGNGVLLAWLGVKLSGRAAIGVVVGVAAVVQPLPLVSGGLFFVPDALAMGLGLAGLAVSFRRTRLGWALAGVLIGLGVMSKETALLFVLLIPLIHASADSLREASRRLPSFAAAFSATIGSWLLVAWLASSTLPGPFDSWTWLLVVGGPPLGAMVVKALPASRAPRRLGLWSLLGVSAVLVVGLESRISTALRPWSTVWSELLKDLNAQMYRGSPWVLVLVPIVAGLVWGLWRRRDALAIVGMALFLAGIPLIIHSVRLGGGLRNGVLVAYGVAVLLGGLVSEAPGTEGRIRTARATLVVGLVGMFMIGSAAASYATNHRLDERSLTSDTTSTGLAAAYIADLDAHVVVTPAHASMLWFLGDGGEQIQMVPMHLSIDGGSEFDSRAWWLGAVPTEAPREEEPITVNVARTSVTAFYRTAIVDHVSDTGAQYLAVTGNLATIASAFDAGGLLPTLERDPNAIRVYSTDTAYLPQWVVVYRLTGPLTLSGPTYIHLAVDVETPSFAEGQVSVTNAEYQEMILSVMNSPIEVEGG